VPTRQGGYVDFDLVVKMADQDERSLDPKIRKLILEWKLLPDVDGSLDEYRSRVEENKGVGFPLYEPPKGDPWLKEMLREKIIAML
jgi:hypothetical protein